MEYIGIDIGGTSIKGVIVSSDGEIVRKTEVDSGASSGPSGVRAGIQESIRSLEKKSSVVGIGSPECPMRSIFIRPATA